jgi:hypothetical protein
VKIMVILPSRSILFIIAVILLLPPLAQAQVGMSDPIGPNDIIGPINPNLGVPNIDTGFRMPDVTIPNGIHIDTLRLPVNAVVAGGGGHNCGEPGGEPCEKAEGHKPESETPNPCEEPRPSYGLKIQVGCEEANSNPQPKVERLIAQSGTSSTTRRPHTKKRHRHHVAKAQVAYVQKQDSSGDMPAMVILAVVLSLAAAGGIWHVAGKSS